MNGFGDPKPATYPWEPYHEAMKVLPEMFRRGQQLGRRRRRPGDGHLGRAPGTAVRRALEKAAGHRAGKYFDGTFFGRSAADDHGYGTALVTIERRSDRRREAGRSPCPTAPGRTFHLSLGADGQWQGRAGRGICRRSRASRWMPITGSTIVVAEVDEGRGQRPEVG